MTASKEAKELLRKEGIVGVSDPENVIRVYVETEEDLSKLPETIMGMSVVGVVTGRFYTLKSRTDRWRPAPGGVSIGHKDITAGTLGCVVIDNETGEKLILSNNHVLADCNRGKIGDEIYQPGPYDHPICPEDLLARLYRYVEIKEPPHANLVDAAVAKPIQEEWVSDEILEVGKVKGVATVSEGDVVKKSGRTTGVTEAKVFDCNATVKVYGYPWGYSIFEDQMLTYAMAAGGDSGSLVLNKNNQAVGLLFAGSDRFTVVNKIHHVLSLLNVSFPSAGTVRSGVSALPLLLLGGAYYLYTKMRRR